MEISVSGFIGDLFSFVGAGARRSIVDQYAEWVAQVHAEGFARLWTPQLPWEPDLLTLLAVALREVPDIELGAAVLPIQPAHPTLTAQRALTLSQASGGRFILGLGVNHPGMTEEFWGVPWDKPVRRMREYLDALFPLLAADDGAAGSDTAAAGGALHIGGPAPQVYIAALGPQMLSLAGRRTAETITWMTGPKTLAHHIGPTLRAAAAAEAGRPEGAVKVIAAAVNRVPKGRTRAR